MSAKRAASPAKRDAHQREDIERWLDGKSVKWVYHPGLRVDSVDAERSLRNQARIFQVLNDETLATYVEALKRGDEFPAVVVTKLEGSFIIVDGNHRLRTYTLCGEEHIPAYELVDVDPRLVVMLTFEANARHGLPTSVAERLRHAIYLVDSGATQADAAAALNVTVQTLGKAWSLELAERRAHRMRIPAKTWDGMNQTLKTRLNNIRQDEPFLMMTKLVHEARLNIDEAGPLITDMNRRRSISAQKQFIEEQRNLLRPRIQSTGGGVISGEPRSAAKRQWQLCYGQVMNIPKWQDDLAAETPLAERMDIIAKCAQAQEVLADLANKLKADL